MKEIKAYIRCQKADDVLRELERVGVTDITLIDVMGVGMLADPKRSKYSARCVEKFSKVAKIEVVCPEERVHTIVEVIRQSAYTGMKGDGIVFVTPVEMAVKIRSGAIGEGAL